MAAIVAGDIKWRYTTVAGAAGGAGAGTAGGSLGKYASTTEWAGSVANDLFDDVSGAENAASTVDYRGIAIHNANAANAYQNAVAYISAETALGASIAIAIDSTAASAYTASPAQMLQIANETTAPAAISFSSPTTVGAGLSLGSIPVANVKGLWVRRTAANTAALSNDGVTLAVSGDTGSL